MIDDGNKPGAWKILAKNDERGKYILIDKMYFVKEQDEGETFSDGNTGFLQNKITNREKFKFTYK